MCTYLDLPCRDIRELIEKFAERMYWRRNLTKEEIRDINKSHFNLKTRPALALSRAPWLMPYVYRPTYSILAECIRSRPDLFYLCDDPSPALCRMAIAKDGALLRYISADRCTLELARLSMPAGIRYIPDCLKTDDQLCIAMLELDIHNINHVWHVGPRVVEWLKQRALTINDFVRGYTSPALCVIKPKAYLHLDKHTHVTTVSARPVPFAFWLNKSGVYLLAPNEQRLLGPFCSSQDADLVRDVITAAAWKCLHIVV